MDTRRELSLIRKQYRDYHKRTGEFITWFSFISFGANGSSYDDVYDEGPAGSGGKKYKKGIPIPIIQITETEDTKRAIPEGRQPVQVVNVVLSIDDMRDAGVPDTFEYQRHLNDMFFYDARYYQVTMYRVRGRAKDDVLVVIEGIEVYVDDEMPNDPGPEAMRVDNFPWPASLPSIS
jgi:hypothetical protein